MKKAISLILVILTVVTAMTSLASCTQSDAPAGMQLVRGGDDIGYYLYGPEEWIVANQENFGIACTYVSKLDNTSVTLTEAELPSVTIQEYVEESLAEFPAEFGVELTLEPKECSFGNAEKAYKISYTYTYNKFTYRAMQIFGFYDSRFYIFTYTASTADYSLDVSYYDNYIEKVEAIITNLRFVEKAGSGDKTPPVYEKDGDGYSLVSNRELCYFDLYIPEEYTLDFASSIVSVSHENGANINVSEATDTNTTDEGYWKRRFEQLEVIADDIKEVDGSKVGVDLGEGLDAVSLEYTYNLRGKSYHVYQVLIVNGFRGFVFTFTAEEANFADMLPEVKTILYKMKF